MRRFAVPLLAAIIVQVGDTVGGCWGARYSAPAVENDATEVRERSD